MKARGLLGLVLLAAYGAWIWWQDRSWMPSAGDVVPILVGLPLFVWMGGPWQWRPEAGKVSRVALVVAALGWVVGSATGISFGLALSFAALCWAWVGTMVEPGPGIRFRSLTLVVLAFPWVLQDLERVGWYFRLSGAAVSEAVFRVLGMSVSRSGVDLIVENLSMSVEAQCAGLNSLQAMLLAGVFLACRFFPEHRVFWWMLPACAAAAWAANTLRILLITVSALTFSPEFAMGTFHNSGGLVALLLSFGLAAGGMRLVLAILHRTARKQEAIA
jgi:exosortase